MPDTAVYALNLYDIIAGKEDTYREYMLQSATLMEGIDAEPVLACHNPVKAISGNTRKHMVVMKFASLQDFETLMSRQEEQSIGALRESSTSNYLWTIYEEWDVAAWLFPDGA